MPPRKNRTLNEIHEQELEDRVMARMKERFDQFADQLSDRMDQLMNKRGNHNVRGTDDEQSENPFGEDDDNHLFKGTLGLPTWLSLYEVGLGVLSGCGGGVEGDSDWGERKVSTAEDFPLIWLGLILYRALCTIKGVLSLDLSKVTITLQATILDPSLGTTSEMDPYNHSTPTSIKLPILDTGKFEQWKFRIQQYLQHQHYALWEVIEFGGSYKAPPEETGKGVTGEGSAKKKGRTVAISVEDC
ncbi:hypothetical protein Tco_0089261 [Tanacetum coccineum]